jgi:hypothetical protein
MFNAAIMEHQELNYYSFSNTPTSRMGRINRSSIAAAIENNKFEPPDFHLAPG